jgi:hypothetical protein
MENQSPKESKEQTSTLKQSAKKHQEVAFYRLAKLRLKS